MEIKKYEDGYERNFSSYEDLLAEVIEMEDHSRWYNDILSKDIAINPIDFPIMAPQLAVEYHMEEDVVVDTASDEGTRLFASTNYGDKNLCIRKCAINSLLERASLFGAALGRVTPADFATIINLALNVSRGPALILERYGKIAAFHSDAGSGYRIMPISTLLEIVNRELGRRFGTPVFLTGYNSHSYTTGIWMLDDMTEEFKAKYGAAVSRASGTSHIDVNFIPCVRFSSSDTANCSAILEPLFRLSNGSYLHFTDGIKVKHVRAVSGLEGVEKFEQEVQMHLFTKFQDAIEAAGRLSTIEIWNPENCVVSICNKLKVAKKYGDYAREAVERLSINTPCLSALDIYVVLTEMIGEAQYRGATQTTIDALEEKIYTVMNPAFNWKDHDVGGLVSWGNN